jgi:urea transport system permease protein
VREGKATDAATGAAATLPEGAEDVVNNNRMRRGLEAALAALQLFSTDTAERKNAIDKLKAKKEWFKTAPPKAELKRREDEARRAAAALEEAAKKAEEEAREAEENKAAKKADAKSRRAAEAAARIAVIMAEIRGPA